LLNRQYKEVFGGFAEWDQLSHAEEYVLFPQNMGPHLSMDETALSSDELYTIVTNKDAKGKKGTLVAMIRGTRSDAVINILNTMAKETRNIVRELTIDLSPTMMLIAQTVFPKAEIVHDRFHVQQLLTTAMNELRMKFKREALAQENAEKQLCKEEGKDFTPWIFRNGDTLRQLYARSNRLLMKNIKKWTKSQQERAEILFENCPQLKEAYGLNMGLTAIFNNCTNANTAIASIEDWMQKVIAFGHDAFNTVADTIKLHLETITNYFNSRATNASAESFNAKVKLFRAQLKGVYDIPFFIYRLKNLFA